MYQLLSRPNRKVQLNTVLVKKMHNNVILYSDASNIVITVVLATVKIVVLLYL